jgi:hypothetical protein
MFVFARSLHQFSPMFALAFGYPLVGELSQLRRAARHSFNDFGSCLLVELFDCPNNDILFSLHSFENSVEIALSLNRLYRHLLLFLI